MPVFIMRPISGLRSSRFRSHLFWVVVCLFCTISPSMGQLARLTHPELTEHGLFGRHFAIHASHLIISEPHYSTDTQIHSGRVHEFMLAGDTWNHIDLLEPPTHARYGNFGHALAREGSFMFISAPGVSNGRVYIYTFENGNWSLRQELAIPAEYHRNGRHIMFGDKVVLSGDWVAITAPGYNGDQNSIIKTGAVFLFQLENDTWHFRQRIIPADTSVAAQFGNDIVMQEHNLLIASAKGNGGADQSGVVYLYSLPDETGWTLAHTFLDPDSRSHELFGEDIDMHEDIIVIGAPMHTSDVTFGPQGIAHIFQRFGEGWIRTARLMPDDGKRNDLFGYTVCVEGHQVFVGSPRFDQAHKTDAGKVSHYSIQNSVWSKVGEFHPPSADAQPHMQFGSHLMIEDGHIVISGHLMDNEKEDSGIAYTTRVETSTSTDDIENSQGFFSLSPNPAHDVLHLQLNHRMSGPVHVMIYNSAGVRLHAESFTATSTTSLPDIHISFLPSGNYFLHIQAGGFNSIQKWIKI